MGLQTWRRKGCAGQQSGESWWLALEFLSLRCAFLAFLRRRRACFGVSPGRHSMISTPPMTQKPLIERTGLSGAGHPTLSSTPPISAMPDHWTRTPGGTIIFTPPMAAISCRTILLVSMEASRKSRTVAPITVSTVCVRAGIQLPRRAVSPQIETMRLWTDGGSGWVSVARAGRPRSSDVS